jgi:hypothetical protein
MSKYLIRVLLLLEIPVILGGCSDQTLTTYLYSPNLACYQKVSLKPKIDQCDELRVTDKVTLQINPERQAVTYSLKGLRLSKENSIFGSLENCKVVDNKNFSCDGLKEVDGIFTIQTFFGEKIISSPSWLYAVSNYGEIDITKKQIFIANEYERLIDAALFIAFIILIVAISS